MTQTSPLITWDFTLFITEENDEKEIIDSFLSEHTKRWAYQLEEGEVSGKLHFQGRFSLKEKLRKTAIIKLFCKTVCLSPTTNDNRDNNFYVTKNETRVQGPWTSEDMYIPKQIRNIQLYEWQEHIVNDAKVWNTRTINVVIDKNGNNGKSILKTYIGVHQLGRNIPYSNDYRDIMRMVMATKKTSLYIIDIPRAIKKDHLYQFFSGIESIKDGYAYDDRYHFKEEFFDCPNIWIFMNHKPELSYLSNDRWRFWSLENKTLTPLEISDSET